MIIILDEDLEGNITIQEYYDALEAYNCCGEKHGPMDDEDVYIPFEHKAAFKLIRLLKEKNMSHNEFFRSCDISGDKQINLKELE